MMGAVSAEKAIRNYLSALYADRVILLDKGKIIEQGPPAQLLEEGGLFSRLYDLQAEGV